MAKDAAGVAFPFMLSVLWALIATVLFAVPAIIRTAHEDWLLHRDLPGYEAYARRICYRLLPGVW